MAKPTDVSAWVQFGGAGVSGCDVRNAVATLSLSYATPAATTSARSSGGPLPDEMLSSLAGSVIAVDFARLTVPAEAPDRAANIKAGEIASTATPMSRAATARRSALTPAPFTNVASLLARQGEPRIDAT
jgi:hypothetical protein